MNIFQEQYALVSSSREVLFGYCEGISTTHFLEDNSSFGRGSIKNLLIHIVNCYLYWIGEQVLGKEVQFISFEQILGLKEVRQKFEQVDQCMLEFFPILLPRLVRHPTRCLP